MSMTVGEIRKVTKKVYDPTKMAETLLQEYWEKTGHQRNINETPDYERTLHLTAWEINRKLEEIADMVDANVRALDYGKYTTGKYQLTGSYAGAANGLMSHKIN